jgi:hypothetical protein
MFITFYLYHIDPFRQFLQNVANAGQQFLNQNPQLNPFPGVNLPQIAQNLPNQIGNV